MTTRIERLAGPVDERDLGQLAALLVDAVESGAAVSFVLPLTVAAAAAWWRKTIDGAHPRAVFLVARDPRGIVGSVQMHPAWAPNQPDRGEITKMMVHRRARRGGIGEALMHAIEQESRASGIRLLTLDAKAGGAAERLYRRLGWTYVGTIPRFAVDPDGVTPHDAVIFYKELA